MTTRSDMIELAKRRTVLNQTTSQKVAQRALVDTTVIYQSVSAIAEERGLSADQVRYAMEVNGVEPVKVPSRGLSSYAHGYPEKKVREILGAIH